MTIRILENYIHKKEKILLKGGDLRGLSNQKTTKEFESEFPVLLENVLVEYVKTTFIEYAADSLMIPWIYLSFHSPDTVPQQYTPNKNAGDATALTGLGESAIDKSKKQSHSLNSSRLGGGYHMGLGTSINKSGAGLLAQSGIDPNQFNSKIDESGLDIEMEFGYQTDEDSIFHSFE